MQSDVLPLDEDGAVAGVRRRIKPPSVAVDVPRGRELFLLASPTSDTFVGLGGRVPGLLTIEDAVVDLPTRARRARLALLAWSLPGTPPRSSRPARDPAALTVHGAVADPGDPAPPTPPEPIAASVNRSEDRRLQHSSDGVVGEIAPDVPAAARSRVATRQLRSWEVVHGVRAQTWEHTDARGRVRVHLLRVDPDARGVKLDYANRGSVAPARRSPGSWPGTVRSAGSTAPSSTSAAPAHR